MALDFQTVVIVVLAVLVVSNVVIIVQFFKQKGKIQTLLNATKEKSLEALLHEITTDNDNIKKKQEEIMDLYSHVRSISERSLQKTALIRFNPFKDTGGDQSFALCVLDHTDSGFIITAIHSRETTRVYTKKIDNGSAKLSLSKEEQQALSKIINKK